MNAGKARVSLQNPVIFWCRKDLRLSDNPALHEAARHGPVIPLVIRDEEVDDLGACPKWRFGLGLEHLADELARRGSRLIFRSGPALSVLREVMAETGAQAVHYNRDYTPTAIARDTEIKSALKSDGATVESHNGALLFEPWTVETGQGGPYRVYSPFWRAVKDRDVPDALPAPEMQAPKSWPASETLGDWALGAGMRRGADVVAQHVTVGEDAAMARLASFLDERIDGYKRDRDHLDLDACSGLSENLAWGEISPRQIWHRGRQAQTVGAAGAEHFLKELVWREFAYHLLYHYPHITTRNWREEWDAFPWGQDEARLTAWQRGQTGVELVDAAMREIYVTGRMHNRARMIVASYLTKHLMIDWRHGLAWFQACLTDWDPASNAMGWQWVAGSGPDAAPFFRIFNPDGQAEKFDARRKYRDHYLDPTQAGAKAFAAAIPVSWGDPEQRPSAPAEPLADGRNRALAAYETLKSKDGTGAPA